MMRHSLRSSVLAVLAVAVLAGWCLGAGNVSAAPAPPTITPGPPGLLAVKFFDVGQADAILIRCPGHVESTGHATVHRLLIDSGDSRYPGSRANFTRDLDAEMTSAAPNDTITTVVATHPHADHIASMRNWVLKKYKVEHYVDNGDNGDDGDDDSDNRSRASKVLHDTVASLSSAHTTEYINGHATKGVREIPFCSLADTRILVPWAVDESLSGPNDRSVAVRLEYPRGAKKTKSFLFAGDIEAAGEGVLLNDFSPEDRQLLDVDVLKAGHHGSDTSSTEPFIKATSPDVVVISCGNGDVGTNHLYKHPRHSTLDAYARCLPMVSHPAPARKRMASTYDRRLKKWMQVQPPPGVWLTSVDGTITLYTDGNTIDVRPEK